ncbi:MAG: hypothetical protein MJZ11_08205 [Lachnospiraceae bacterium]|nr:hypothetical protein [Lachnospiraceae bacterium]
MEATGKVTAKAKTKVTVNGHEYNLYCTAMATMEAPVTKYSLGRRNCSADDAEPCDYTPVYSEATFDVYDIDWEWETDQFEYEFKSVDDMVKFLDEVRENIMEDLIEGFYHSNVEYEHIK